jgi:hypothetical protein
MATKESVWAKWSAGAGADVKGFPPVVEVVLGDVVDAAGFEELFDESEPHPASATANVKTASVARVERACGIERTSSGRQREVRESAAAGLRRFCQDRGRPGPRRSDS